MVGVNFYEAQAYAGWISMVAGTIYRLPDEIEWEKASRGTDGRMYPWGKGWDSSRCNTIESHIYTTSPIGLFENGRSPYDIFDAAGNVYEWTNNWYQPYQGSSMISDDFGEKYRVLRGGSWENIRGYARCACRGRVVPDYFNYYIGFRLLSPGAC